MSSELNNFEAAAAANPAIIREVLAKGIVLDEMVGRMKQSGFQVERAELDARLRGDLLEPGAIRRLPGAGGSDQLEAGYSWTWTFTFQTVQAYTTLYIIAEAVVGIVVSIA